MFHSRIFDAKYLVAAFLALGLAVVVASCSGGDDKEGKGGTGGSVDPNAEVCDNEADDNADGKIDCQDPECEETEHCCPGGRCRLQCGVEGQSACDDIAGTVELVCSPEGKCEYSGQVDADGQPIKGEAMVMSKMNEINASMNYAVEQLLVLSSARPNTTERATCAAIMGREIDPSNPNHVNVVFQANAPVAEEADYIPAPAFGVPLPKEGDSLLAVVRFYSSKWPGTTNPRGDIVGEGCAEFATIPAGYYNEDPENPDRKWEVVIRLFCGGYLNRECPDPKECVLGLCRDNRCGTCGPGYACREWNGEPDCRKACNPDQPDCPNLHRCDATTGEVAVCVPAE